MDKIMTKKVWVVLFQEHQRIARVLGVFASKKEAELQQHFLNNAIDYDHYFIHQATFHYDENS
jgi:hypothetical protein